jgi:hypothetical protein
MIKRTPANKTASPTAKKSKQKSARPSSRRRSSGFQYQTLEQRLPLDASFGFEGGVLTINGFTEETQLTIDAGADVTVRIDGETFLGDQLPGLEFPDIEVTDEGEVESLGDNFVAMGVTELVVNATGFGAPPTNTVINFNGEETIDVLSVNITGTATLNSNGNDYDLVETNLTTGANLVQTDNRPGTSTGIDLGTLTLNVGGSATLEDLVVDTVGGEVDGNLIIVTEDSVDEFDEVVFSNIIFNNQTDRDFNGDGAPDGLRVRGDANITIEDGLIGQTIDSSVIVDGTLTLTTASAGNAPILLNGSGLNDFNQIVFGDASGGINSDISIFDVDDFAFEVVNLSPPPLTTLSGTLHLAAGRGRAGGLTFSGDIVPETAIFQARSGFTQTSGLIRTPNLLLGGVSSSEGGGNFIFNGSIEGPINDDDLSVFDFSARVRGNLDFTTNSEINLTTGSILYPDDRAEELFEDSWVDGNTRINANRLIFDASLETTKFVLTVESDVLQTADTSVVTEQLYVTGKEIDLSNDTNDTGQLAARAFGDESFIRYSDVGTFRIVSLDGSIEGGSSNIADPGTINGLSTERIPEVLIGERSFIDITTGLGGPVENPRLGAPPVELDDIETFEVIRDATNAQFLTDEFGQDDRGVFFVEFIYDGISPFEFVAESNQFDAELALYDEVGNLVFVSDDPSFSLDASIADDDIEGGLASGRYYLASAAFSATFGDNFDVQTEFDDGTPAQPRGTLLITLESPFESEDPDETEPYELLLARLESFIAPEVRRSFFQNEDAPIDTEKLFVSALEDGSIEFTSTQNRIDEICIFETDDFVLHSSNSITIDTLNADANVLLTAPEFIIVNDLTAQGNVQIETPGNVVGRNVDAGGDLNVSGNFVNLAEVDSGANVSITATSTAVLTDVDVAGSVSAATSTDDIVVDGVRAQGDVNLAAADDIRLSNPTGIRRLEAANLSLFADNINNDGINGVFLFTDADSITSNIGSGGQIFINERSAVDANLTTDSGPISLRANGDITGTVGVTRPGHNISLSAIGNGSDILVDSVTALGSNDNIRLFADDDIAGNVEGGNLLVQARNDVADQDVSIQLNTTVRTLNVNAGVIANANPNRGDIIVNESNPLIVTRAVAANGRISISANGSLSTVNVQSNRMDDGNAIVLTANGIGSDLLTSRVVVRDGTAGVLLTAGDDIVDGNINDRLAVVADRVTFEAGNNTSDSFDGLIAHTFAKSISVTLSSSAEAGAFVFNTGNTIVQNTLISNGQFSLNNRSGSVQIDDVSISSQQLSNRVFVKTRGIGGDVLVGDIDAGRNGIVTIDSADDVLDTDLLDEFFISGEILNVTARNNKIDSFDGIILNIDVDEFADNLNNGGETFVRRQS